MAKSKKHYVNLNGGEWSRKLHDRVDHEKYPSALRIAKNVVPYPQGPLAKRKGQEFLAPAKYDDKPCNWIEFQFSRDDSVAIEAGDGYLRFHLNSGLQVFDNAGDTTVTATASNPVVLTRVGHGNNDGDEIYCYDFVDMTELNGRWFKVTGVTENTMNLTDRDGVPVDGTTWTPETTGGKIGRVYEVATPYTADEVFELDYTQKDDVIWITHRNHEPRRLVRTATNPDRWSLGAIDYEYPPMLVDNVDESKSLQISALSSSDPNFLQISSVTSPSVTYDRGCGDNHFIYVRYFDLVFASDHGLSGGEDVTISGVNCDSWYDGNSSGALNEDVDGVYSVSSVIDSKTIRIVYGDSPCLNTGFFLAPRPVTFFYSLDAGATVNTGGVDNVTMTAVGHSPFEAGHVGSYWALAHIQDSQTFSINNANGNRVPQSTNEYIRVLNTWKFETGGTWSGTIDLLKSRSDSPSSPYDPSEWEVVESVTSNSSSEGKNFLLTGDQEGEQAYFSFKYSSIASDADITLNTPSQEIRGFVKVLSFVDSQNVIVSVEDEVISTDATDIWAEGAWSSVRGFPNCTTFFEGRIWFGGTAFNPQTLWSSEVEIYDNFLVGKNDTDALSIELSAQERNEVLWLAGRDKLLVGTSGGEWTISGTDLNSIISPTNITARRQDTRGSERIRPIITSEGVIFVQRGGRRIREFDFSLERDRYYGEDLMVFAEHLSRGKVDVISYSGQPDSIIWAINGRGELLTMSYEKDQNVFAWTRHESNGGAYESVETVYGGDRDQVYLCVKRTVGGKTRRFVERIVGVFDTNEYTTDEELLRDEFFLDAGKTTEGTDMTSIGGLWHLEGEELTALIDGIVTRNLTVTNGIVTLPIAGNIVHVGYPYEARVKTLRLDADGAAGVHQSLTKRITKVFARFMDTVDVTYNNGQKDYPLPFRTPDDLMDNPSDLFDGERELQLSTGYDKDVQFELISADPLPFTLRSLTVHYEITGE